MVKVVEANGMTVDKSVFYFILMSLDLGARLRNRRATQKPRVEVVNPCFSLKNSTTKILVSNI